MRICKLPQCQNEVINKDKRTQFCSRTCASIHRNTGVRRHGKGLIKKECLLCHKEFFHFSSRSVGKYCSTVCQNAWQRKNIIEPTIERGENKNVGSLKRYLLETRGEECNICKCPAIHNSKPLRFELHHIDGNSDNNFPKNLQILCPNCHSQIPYTTKKKNTQRSKINGMRKIINLP